LEAFFGFACFFPVMAVAGVTAESITSADFPVGRIYVEGFLEGMCAPLAGGTMVFLGGQGWTRELSGSTHRCPKFGERLGRSARVSPFVSPRCSVRGLSAYPHGPFRTAQDHLCRLAGDSLSSEENIEKASSMICEYVRPRVGKGNWAQAIYKAGPQRDNLCTSGVCGIENEIQWCPSKNVVPRTYPFWHFSDLNLRWADACS
jgi:hypothetical protein